MYAGQDWTAVLSFTTVCCAACLTCRFVLLLFYNFCFHTYGDTAGESQNKQRELLKAVQHHLPPLLLIFCTPGEGECSEGRHTLLCGSALEPTYPSVSAIWEYVYALQCCKCYTLIPFLNEKRISKDYCHKGNWGTTWLEINSTCRWGITGALLLTVSEERIIEPQNHLS